MTVRPISAGRSLDALLPASRRAQGAAAGAGGWPPCPRPRAGEIPSGAHCAAWSASGCGRSLPIHFQRCATLTKSEAKVWRRSWMRTSASRRPSAPWPRSSVSPARPADGVAGEQPRVARRHRLAAQPHDGRHVLRDWDTVDLALLGGRSGFRPDGVIEVELFEPCGADLAHPGSRSACTCG